MHGERVSSAEAERDYTLMIGCSFSWFNLHISGNINTYSSASTSAIDAKLGGTINIITYKPV